MHVKANKKLWWGESGSLGEKRNYVVEEAEESGSKANLPIVHFCSCAGVLVRVIPNPALASVWRICSSLGEATRHPKEERKGSRGVGRKEEVALPYAPSSFQAGAQVDVVIMIRNPCLQLRLQNPN